MSVITWNSVDFSILFVAIKKVVFFRNRHGVKKDNFELVQVCLFPSGIAGNASCLSKVLCFLVCVAPFLFSLLYYHPQNHARLENISCTKTLKAFFFLICCVIEGFSVLRFQNSVCEKFFWHMISWMITFLFHFEKQRCSYFGISESPICALYKNKGSFLHRWPIVFEI